MAEEIKDAKIEDEDVKDDKSKEETSEESEESKESEKEKKVKEQKTFTQEQVNTMMAKEKRQGKNSAFRELGIDPKDKKLINVLQSALKQNVEEDGESATDSKVQQAEERVLIAETQVEALKQGAQPSYVDDLVTLIISKGNEDGLELNELVSEYKTKYPDWFKLTEEEKREESAGTGSTLKGASKEKKDLSTKGIGTRLAAQRKTNKAKKSYWD